MRPGLDSYNINEAYVDISEKYIADIIAEVRYYEYVNFSRFDNNSSSQYS